jgi:hypothetical protein
MFHVEQRRQIVSRRGKDADWNIYEAGNTTWEKVPVAVLMDIRDEMKAARILASEIRSELKLINQTLRCPDFQSIPMILKGIRAKLPSKKERDATQRKS